MWSCEGAHSAAIVVLVVAALSGSFVKSAVYGEPSMNNNRKLATGCEGKVVSISCSENSSMLQIRKADFKKQSTPPECGSTDSNRSACESSRLLQAVQTSCQNQTSCVVPKDVFYLCEKNTAKYLVIEYTCVSAIRNTPIGHSFSVSLSPPITIPVANCPSQVSRKIQWDSTPAGTNATAPCFNNNSLIKAKWFCSKGPPVAWADKPDFSSCLSPVIAGFQKSIPLVSIQRINTTSFRSTATAMVRHTSTATVYGQDLKDMTSVMHRMVASVENEIAVSNSSEINNLVKDLSAAVLETSSNLLQDTWTDLPEVDWSGTATKLLTAVEVSAFQLANSVTGSHTVTNITRNIVLEISVIDSRSMDSINEVVFPHSSRLKNSTWSTNNSIRLTAGTIKSFVRNGHSRLVFAVYKNLESWMRPSSERRIAAGQQGCSTGSNDQNCTTERFINSKIISAAINSRKDGIKLESPVTFTLAHNVVENASFPDCVFWNYSENLQDGDWSSDGCTVVETNTTHTTCSCNHLTNFAIIMSPTQPNISAANEFALTFITYFGCSISILCLMICFLTFQCFKSLQCDRNTIHKNLVLCLLVANTIFLAGIMQYEIPTLCAVIAGFLHYFFLTSFAWMCLEGIQLYVMLVEIFEAEKSRVLWYYISAYGCPAIIVGVSAAIYHQGYGTPNHCWLSVERGFVWSFLGPACAVICVNIGMLGIAVHAMVRHLRASTALRIKEKSKLEQIKQGLKGTIILVVLLGLTWMFGLLFFDANTVVFAYIFAILNSLQGTFIFIFYCLMNSKVQAEYKKLIAETKCLPESFRIKYGGPRASSLPSSPNRSSASTAGPLTRLLGGRRRKSSDSTFISKSASDVRRKSREVSVAVYNPPGVPVPQVILSEIVDSGFDDPASYSEQPAQIHLGESEFEGEDISVMEGSTVDTEFLQRLPLRSEKGNSTKLSNDKSTCRSTVDDSKSESLPFLQYSKSPRLTKRLDGTFSEHIDSVFDSSGKSRLEPECQIAAEQLAERCRFINGTAV